MVVGQVEIEQQLVAGEGLALGVLGQELHEAVAHDVELHVGVRGAVRRTTAAAGGPRVADQALGEVEVADLQHLTASRRGPADDRAQRADLARGGVEHRQEVGQVRDGAVRAQHPALEHPARVVAHRDERSGQRLVRGDVGEAERGVGPRLGAGVGMGRDLPVASRGEALAGGVDECPGRAAVEVDPGVQLREVRVAVEQVDAHVTERGIPRHHDESGCVGRVLDAEVHQVALPRGTYCVVGHGVTVDSPVVRIVVARCQVDYAGRLSAHLPLATRVLMLKSDGSVLIHSDGGSYKPLNWMSPPCTVREGTSEDGRPEWLVTATKTDDTLRILIDEVLHDTSHDLGVDPGLQKDGVEKHLQELLAEHPATLADGLTLVRREFMTAIGPVDLMCRDADGLSVAVEIKRRGEIDGVEQLTRYLELLNRDPMLTARGPVRGIYAAQEIKPQARVLATDRGIACALVDYDALRGMDDAEHRLF